MTDGRNRVTVLCPGHYTLPYRPGCKLSLLAFTEKAEGVCLRGTEWELENAVLTSRYPLGTSNEITSSAAELSFTIGAVTVVYAKDDTFVTMSQNPTEIAPST